MGSSSRRSKIRVPKTTRNWTLKLSRSTKAINIHTTANNICRILIYMNCSFVAILACTADN